MGMQPDSQVLSTALNAWENVLASTGWSWGEPMENAWCSVSTFTNAHAILTLVIVGGVVTIVTGCGIILGRVAALASLRVTDTSGVALVLWTAHNAITLA